MFLTNEAGEVQLTNRQAEMLFGYSKEELTGKPAALLMAERFREQYRDLCRQYAAGSSLSKTSGELAIIACKKDGSKFSAEVRLSGIALSGNKMVVASIRDVSERKKAELQLKGSENRFRGTLDSMLEGVTIIGFDWRYLYVNETIAGHGKRSKEEMVGRTLMDIYAGVEQTALFKALEKCMRERVVVHVEVPFHFPDHSTTWFEMRVHPVPEGIFALTIDITERKKTQTRLALSEKKYRLLFQSNPLPMWVFDLQTLAFLTVNKAAVQHYGYSKEEFLRMTIRDIRPSRTVTEDFLRIAYHPQKSLDGGIWQHKKKNGEIILVNVILNNVEYEGRSARLVLVHDVTAWKKAETLLVQSEQRYRQLVENVSDAIVLDDAEGNVLFANKRFLDLHGLSDADLAHLTLEKYVAPEYRTILREWHNKRMAGEAAPELFEFEGLHKNGSKIWLEVQVSKVLEDGVVKGTLSAIRDITERKKSELKLNEAMLATQRINKELEQFTYMVSHDLQEPLRMVSGFLNLLQAEAGGQLNDDAKEYIAYAADGAERMRQMIADLLHYSRVGNNKEDWTPVDVQELVRYVLRVLQQPIEAMGASVQVGPLPVITANKTLLTLLFQNLVGNALKYHGRERPQIEVGAACEQGHWTFFVKDNGIGIDPKYFERIFIIFQRLHDKTTYSGTGIGLAICKKIVEKHGGKIWVTSEVGKGSTFYFTVPDNRIP
jgi:PAS domain S-box-containing protein